MKAKGVPRDFVSSIVRVTKTKVVPSVAAGGSSPGAARPRPFLVHALPLRARKRSA
jgi:hypothetical protein